jgi:cellulose synthase/poly-beta-1,6-N-acetylglucosamine synthase-like glycosyltransferase
MPTNEAFRSHPGPQWQERLPNLRIVRAAERGSASYARNTGIHAAQGEYLLFCDADDVAEETWIESLVEALKGYDVVSGPIAKDALNPHLPEAYVRHQQTGLPVNAWNHRAFAPSGNLGVRKAVALAIGGFDESMDPCEDQDFSWRAADSGARLGFSHGAVVQVRVRESLAAAWRQAFGWGLGSMKLYVRHRGDRLSLRLSAWTLFAMELARFFWLLPRVVTRHGRYNWVASAGILAGQLRGMLRKRASSG